MPEIHWRHYAENNLAPIRRKLTRSTSSNPRCQNAPHHQNDALLQPRQQQMKGLGFWFQARINSSIASFKSGTLTKLPRRIAFCVNSLNQRSTKFSQLELVGTKWHTNLGCFFSHACTCGSLCVALGV